MAVGNRNASCPTRCLISETENYLILWMMAIMCEARTLELALNYCVQSMNGITQGFVCETMKLFTLKKMDSLFMGKSWPMDPSRNFRFIRVQGFIYPLISLQNKSVGPKTKGMAQLAAHALHIITLGAVRQLRSLSSSCSLVPVTVMLRMQPNWSKASWKVMSPRLSLRKVFSTVISIAHPVFKTLLNSCHRVFSLFLTKAQKLILLPSKKSYLLLVAMRAPIILPALLPAIILGMQSASIRAWTTPMWCMPRMAPPLSRRALRPTACLSSPKNSSFLKLGRSDSIIFLRQSAISSWNSSMLFLVELQAYLQSSSDVILPTLRLLCDRRMATSLETLSFWRAYLSSFLRPSIYSQSQKGEQTVFRSSWTWGSWSQCSASCFHSLQLLALLMLASMCLTFLPSSSFSRKDSQQQAVISAAMTNSSITSCLTVRQMNERASSMYYSLYSIVPTAAMYDQSVLLQKPSTGPDYNSPAEIVVGSLHYNSSWLFRHSWPFSPRSQTQPSSRQCARCWRWWQWSCWWSWRSAAAGRPPGPARSPPSSSTNSNSRTTSSWHGATSLPTPSLPRRRTTSIWSSTTNSSSRACPGGSSEPPAL